MNITFQGRLINTFKSNDGVDNEGKSYRGTYKAQFLIQNSMDSGGFSYKLENLIIEDPKVFEQFNNKDIKFPVIVSVNQFTKSPSYRIPKSVIPELLSK